MILQVNNQALSLGRARLMTDDKLTNYRNMIDASSMKVTRYAMDKAFDAQGSKFTEVMSYDVKEGTDMAQFTTTNYKVETDFTGKRKGFMQRLICCFKKYRNW